MSNNIKEAVIEGLARGVSSLSNAIFRGIEHIARLTAGGRGAEVLAAMGQGKKNTITITLVSVIVLAILSIPLTMADHSPAPKLAFDPAASIGDGIAGEISRLMNGGGKVLILVRDIPGVNTEGVVTPFLDAVKKHGEIIVVGTEKIPHGPASDSDLDGEQYLRILAQHPDVDVVYSYAGLPRLTEEQTHGLAGKKLPKFAAWLQPPSGDVGIKALFEAQLIHLVMFPRMRAPMGAKQPTTGREFFDQSCMVITPDNSSSLPY